MAALHNLPQSWRRLVFLLPVLVITLILATGLYNGSIPKPPIPKVTFGDTPSPSLSHTNCETGSPALNSIPDAIRALWAPLVVPITAPTFTTIDGEEKHLPPPNELVHTEPLGKRVCIFDIDNRDFSGNDSIFYDHLPAWDDLGNPAAGFLSHYLYATIHGYSYQFVRSPKYADRAPHWSKVIFTGELLKQYDIVIGPEVLVAMAEDPNGEPNFDVRGKPNVNTGFIIAQAGEKTQRLFKDWAECPSETRYPGCAAWKDKPFHEQSAFSSYVRYDFLDGYSIDTHPQYIRTLPCKEANGIPEVAGCGCVGQLVRHYWGKKALTNREFSHNVMAALTPLLVESAYKQPGHVQDFRNKVLDGSQILDKSTPWR
ncbi:aee1a434-95fe-40b3-8802-dd5a24d2d1e5 [Thermothielavioides terrestris]|uniref:Aee1a434-95fe-40b3-8802-dd5a24d2d1e5 n=1 Tax=Thermothielavioides terrestris TaxID=2587410 RepID=A0A3S4D5X1_9PEZI|nr:aee1a434-95fe-40b3-8802-dd5a24d2d1e5 [Thermothielavioides terrestris]